ncbi:ester cyclase [Halorussus halophilus]|uniref:ester cyclase n=1 Tax=Halorussus halophilus TaxID=2650975 RepID=UPI0013013FC9|nr:ester cyclase [Halorussus halophilus]
MAATSSTEENKRIVRQATEAFNEQNFDSMAEVFAEDVIDHTPMGETRGRQAVRELSEHLHSAFSDFTVSIEELVAEGDTVALRGKEHGTHEGEFMGIDPTGRQVEHELMEFARIEDGTVVERWVQPDMIDLMQQLGAVELPEK